MGAEQSNNGAWDRVRALAEKLDSQHADKVFVAKGYTKADLRRDLLASIPQSVEVLPDGWESELVPQKVGPPLMVVRRVPA